MDDHVLHDSTGATAGYVVLPQGPIAFDTQVGPHDFRPLGRRDKRRPVARCVACYMPRELHPVSVYSPARPLGDLRPAGVWRPFEHAVAVGAA